MVNLHVLLTKAVALDASDIHLKADRKPHIRVHRILCETDDPPLTLADLQQVVEAILPAHLQEKYKAQGEVDFPHKAGTIGRFRVNASMAQGSPVLNFRYVPTGVPSFEDLNLPRELGEIASAVRGIILVAGTTGAGKSTTMAGMIEYLNNTACHRIITVEDPVEYLFVDKKCVITQREVGLDTGSFETALEHVLRHDPDVIVIGEMRDANSMKTAIAAAETGHLVMSTIHAGTAPVAIHRVLEFFPAEERPRILRVLANTLQAVICQQLLPGAKGRPVPAVEILRSSPVVRGLLEKGDLHKLADSIEAGSDDGMMSFNQSIHQLITKGLVTMEEGLKFSTSEGNLRMMLQGFSVNNNRRTLSRA